MTIFLWVAFGPQIFSEMLIIALIVLIVGVLNEMYCLCVIA